MCPAVVVKWMEFGGIQQAAVKVTVDIFCVWDLGVLFSSTYCKNEYKTKTQNFKFYRFNMAKITIYELTKNEYPGP